MALTRDDAAPTAAPRSAFPRATAEFVLDNLVWLVLVVVLVAFSLGIPNFFQIGILLNIFEQSTFVGTLAIGLSLVIIAGHMDLSIESTMALTAMVTAVLFGSNGAGLKLSMHPAWLNLPVSVALSVAIGVLIGATNGYLVVRLKINAFIVTLASFIWVRGLVVMLSGGRSVYGLPDEIRWVSITSVLGVPMLVWTTLLLFLVFSFVLAKTPFGRHVLMVGGNAIAAFRAGIRVDRLVFTTFLISGGLAGFAGWLLASRTAGATANLGTGMLFEVFAAVVIGGVSLKGGGRGPVGRGGRRAAAELDLDRHQRHGHAAPLHAGDPRRARAGRHPARHRQDVAAPPSRLNKGRSMSGRLQGRVAVVIGAARGIGAAIAERFVEEGAQVVIGDGEVEAGQATVARLGAGARFVETDIARLDHAQRVVAAAETAFGGLDILVQNAGIYPWTLIENISPDEWDRVMAVNLKGTFLAAQAALRPMRERRYGRMVFTSSITGPRVSSPGHGHYAASKAGINGFIKSAAIEFSGYGITVNGVEPGNILTEGMQAHRSPEFIAGMESAVPLGRLGTPRDVANATLFLCSDEAAYITGTTIVVDGGQTLPESHAFRIQPT